MNGLLPQFKAPFKGYFFGKRDFAGAVLVSLQGSHVWEFVSREAMSSHEAHLISLFRMVREVEHMQIQAVSMRGPLDWVNRIVGRWGWRDIPNDLIERCEIISDVFRRRGWTMMAIPTEKNPARFVTESTSNCTMPEMRCADIGKSIPEFIKGSGICSRAHTVA